MESATNRFSEPEDQPIDGTDVTQLMANCEKWSLKNDLELLSHLKRLSHTMITKTEATNQSISSLVFEAKMNCVKVDNVINELQMLANSQFVENRVYDEEMDDIIANDANGVQSVEMVSPKSKEEDILPKIKSALNIGMDFLSQRFDCDSKQVPQNDSDDENDQIVGGLLSHASRDEYSQRLLPYIIGSEDFISDNCVGLSRVDDTPAIDLQTNENDSLSVASDLDTFEVQKTIPQKNIFDDNLSDSDDDSKDIFGSIPPIPQSVVNNERLISSDESDAETFAAQEANEDLIISKDNVIEPKRAITSFQDELSAVISAKNPYKQTVRTNEEQSITSEEKTTADVFVNQKQIHSPIPMDSESSDESDSIFKVNKSKPKIQSKQKSSFDDLFGEQTNDSSLFGRKPDKPKISDKLNKVLSNASLERVDTNNSSLFADEDDDLFSDTNRKNAKIESIVSKAKNSDIFDKKKVINNKKPVVEKRSLFSDDSDDEDMDDLFIGAIDRTVVETVNEENDNSDIFGKSSSKRVEKSIEKSLFSDDDNEDEDADDLFIGAISKKTSIASSISSSLVIENKESKLSDIFNENSDKSSERPTDERKPLFDDEDIDDLFIGANNKKTTIESIVTKEKEKPIVFSEKNDSPKERPVIEKKSLFSDDDSEEDVDDLFSAISKKTTIESIVNNEENAENFGDNSPIKTEKPVIKKRTQISLFGDHNQNNDTDEDNGEEDVDDLFKSAINKKSTEFMDKESENSNIFEDISVKRTENPIVDKKSLFSDDDNDDEDVDDLFVNVIDPKKTIDPIVPEGKPTNIVKNSVTKTEKPIVENKPLFSDEDNDDLFFGAVTRAPTIKPSVRTQNSNIPQQTSAKQNDVKVKPSVKPSIFDDEDDDDLFSAAINKNSKKTSIDSTIKKEKSPNVSNKSVSDVKKTVKSLFDDEDNDDEDVDDLFRGAVSKKKTVTESVANKQNKSFIESLNKVVENNSNVLEKNNVTKKEKPVVESSSVFDDEEDNDLFTAVVIKKTTVEPIVNKAEDEDEDKSPPILVNDGLKQRAILGSKRNRRPPSKRLLKPND
ncbi:unnamed protein product [Oppiella nova]|uniref:WASH complex subunit 2 n=1 Tax=Oppiella nova TaxID=334625 RepID=A0A7R9QBE1_9ACAR|nr:unnamed protein product [Oppiella nova]CAG2162311.1 unnamed protein product [Oppiella nova]